MKSPKGVRGVVYEQPQVYSAKKVKKVVKKKAISNVFPSQMVNHSMVDPGAMTTITSGGDTNIGYVSYIRDPSGNTRGDNSRRVNSNSVEPGAWRRPFNNSNLRQRPGRTPSAMMFSGLAPATVAGRPQSSALRRNRR